MITRAVVRLPRDSTRQVEGLLLGEIGRVLNRWSGLVILAFVAVHVVGQAALRADALYPLLTVAPLLASLQLDVWVRALLFASAAYHSLYGARLIALELGARLSQRGSLVTAIVAALAVALREAAVVAWR